MGGTLPTAPAWAMSSNIYECTSKGTQCDLQWGAGLPAATATAEAKNAAAATPALAHGAGLAFHGSWVGLDSFFTLGSLSKAGREFQSVARRVVANWLKPGMAASVVDIYNIQVGRPA